MSAHLRSEENPRSLSRSIRVSKPVAKAIALNLPVVALESTIITHGMPFPSNLETARDVEDIVRQGGGVPATIAIIQGIIHVGLEPSELEMLAKLPSKEVTKCSRRDIAAVVAGKGYGATTVSATMLIAELVGIQVFVTGGIGGAHRGVEQTWDVSADLTELGRTQVCVVCAGIKSILDIPKTLEILETQGVTVTSLGCDEFPAFFSAKSGIKTPRRLETPKDCAQVFHRQQDLGIQTGMVVAVPVAEAQRSGGASIELAIQQAIREVETQMIGGRDVTPYILNRVNQLSGGKSLEINIALIKNNASVGVQIAKELSSLRRTNIAVVGSCAIDIMFCPSDKLISGTSNPGTMSKYYGGVGRNIAECLGRLGSRPYLISAVGDDLDGKSLVNHISEVGVNVDFMLRRPDRMTSSYISLLDPVSKELALGASDMACIEALTTAFVVESILKISSKLGWVVLDGNLDMDAIKEISACIAPISKLWYEPISVSKAVKCIPALKAGLLSYISPNLLELYALTSSLSSDHALECPSEPSEDLLKKHIDVLFRFGLKSAAICKLGARGVFIGEKVQDTKGCLTMCYSFISAVNVSELDLVNTNGAGDTMVGCILYGLSQGVSLVRSTQVAVMGSALTVQSPNAVSTRLSELSNEFFKTN